MEIRTDSNEFPKSDTATAVFASSISFASSNSSTYSSREETIRIIQSTVASVGIVANLTVIAVFLNHKKLRKKIPNIFIINQVRRCCTYSNISNFVFGHKCSFLLYLHRMMLVNKKLGIRE